MFNVGGRFCNQVFGVIYFFSDPRSAHDAEQVLLGEITWLIHVPGSSIHTAVLNNLVVVILVLHVLNLVPVHRCF